jgi:aminoglycoside 6-adenylyltransferase
MRSETEIKNLLLDFAQKDNRIRAVLLNGSRANPNVKPDILQDFDIVFIIDDLESFISNHSWTDVFGEKIIFQLPDEMNLGNEDCNRKKVSFSYLMLFKDKNRIDLTLFPLQKFTSHFKLDSLTIVWLDKDNLFENVTISNDEDYRIHKPTEKEFLDTCNEFWWVSTYVVKGLLRKEITYAKGMLERVVRPMFMQVIEWNVGIENNFNVSLGKDDRFLELYITNDFYKKILLTYSNFELEENWKALLVMTEVFQQASNFVADKFGFSINKTEEQNTIIYLKEQYNKQKTAANKRTASSGLKTVQQ